MKNKEKLSKLLKAVEMMNEIISLQKEADMIEANINSKPLFDGKMNEWKKDLAFTKKRVELFTYEYETIIITLNK